MLDEAVQVAPYWLRSHLKEAWIKRYGRCFDGYRRMPTSKAKREELAVAIGEDGFYLLEAINAEDGLKALKTSQKAEILRRIWVQQLYRENE